MDQKELQATIGKIYITYQKIRWMKNGQYRKEGTGAWQLAENEQKLDVIMSGKEAAKWTY